jgi:hypothetical protein
MTITFTKGTKVWPVHRDNRSTHKFWCAPAVRLNRNVDIEVAPIPLEETFVPVHKFSQFVELNKVEGQTRRYMVFMFTVPVRRDRYTVEGFVALY